MIGVCKRPGCGSATATPYRSYCTRVCREVVIGTGHSRIKIKPIGLYFGSHPTPAPQIRDAEDAPTVRRLHCRRLSNCLHHACAEGWTGFSCGSCAVDLPLTHDEERRDLEGMAAMYRHAPRVRMRMRMRGGR